MKALHFLYVSLSKRYLWDVAIGGFAFLPQLLR